MTYPRCNTLDLLRRLRHYETQDPHIDSLERGLRGVIIGQLNELSNDRRYDLLYSLFPGKWLNVEAVSTKHLTDQEWNGLYHWAQPYKDEDGDNKWKLHPSVMLEIENSLLWPDEKYLTLKALTEKEFDKASGLDDLPEYQKRMIKNHSEALLEELTQWWEEEQRTMDMDE